VYKVSEPIVGTWTLSIRVFPRLVDYPAPGVVPSIPEEPTFQARQTFSGYLAQAKLMVQTANNYASNAQQACSKVGGGRADPP
jgi:hypothetical protein